MGKTILISSHILPELADFCNKIGIIEQGEMIVAGDVDAIMRQVTGARILEVRVLDDAERAIEVLSAARDVRRAQQEPDEGRADRGVSLRVEYTGDPLETYRLLDALHAAGIRVLALAERETDLEDIFLKVTRGVVSWTAALGSGLWALGSEQGRDCRCTEVPPFPGSPSRAQSPEPRAQSGSEATMTTIRSGCARYGRGCGEARRISCCCLRAPAHSLEWRRLPPVVGRARLHRRVSARRRPSRPGRRSTDPSSPSRRC